MIKKSLLAAVMLTACLSAAPIVQYSTTGVFGSSGTNVGTYGLTNLTFLSGSGGPVDVGFGTANVSFGQFDLNSTQPNPPAPINDTFTLNIFQTQPSAGNSSLVATITGSVSLNFTNTTVEFTDVSATIGLVNYRISNAGNGVPGLVLIPTPTVNNGVGLSSATLQAQISAIPEPATYGFLGAGLVALGVLRRKARR